MVITTMAIPATANTQGSHWLPSVVLSIGLTPLRQIMAAA